MKRVLLGVALATLLVIGGTASAATTASCGAALSVHNAALCEATDKVDMIGEPELGIAVGIGPVEGIFYGDVQVSLIGEESGAAVYYGCVYRPTNGLGALSSSCESSSDGVFIEGETAKCKGHASGIGQWTVTCSVQPVEG